MSPRERRRDRQEELLEFSRTYNTAEGNLIRGRAFVRRRSGPVRYEIVVDGFGQYSVVDVPNYGDLKRVLEVAMQAFATTAELRGSFSVRL